MGNDQRACGLHTGLTLSTMAAPSMPPAGSIGTGELKLDISDPEAFWLAEFNRVHADWAGV